MVVFSCKKETVKPIIPDVKVTVVDSIIYSSKDFEPHLKFNSEFSEYELIGLQNPKEFTPKELTYVVKENNFEFIKSSEFKYFTATNFDFKKTNYKIIAYRTYGENDIKVVNIQLNSYRSGMQTDALLLDSRFTFETEYYSEFKIKKDGSIAIKKLAVNGLLYNEEGDITGKKTAKDTTVEVVHYKMNVNGQFIKT